MAGAHINPDVGRLKTPGFLRFFWLCSMRSAIYSWCRTQPFPPLIRTLGSPSWKPHWRPRADITARDILIDTLRVQLARLTRMQFGKVSEKLSHEIAQLELALEELEAEAATVSARRVDPATLDRPAPVRALPAHLPLEEQRIEPEHGNCTCPDCGGLLRPLGQDSAEMLDAVPVQWRVVRTIRPKYSCRACERVVQAAAPVKAIARGKATFGTLAHVVVAKFDHLLTR